MRKRFRKNLDISQQNGAVLLTALILLVMLTLLGLSSMSSIIMEERMAANTQSINRAFQAAATGIEIVYNDDNAFDTRLSKASDGSESDTYTKKKITGIGGTGANSYHAIATYNSIFIQKTAPLRGSGWDSRYTYYHFDMSATGCVVANATDTDCTNSAIASHTQHQGAYQVGKAQ